MYMMIARFTMQKKLCYKAMVKQLISHPHTARGCLVPAVKGMNSISRWSSDAKRTTAV
jgi:hypothetical protein